VLVSAVQKISRCTKIPEGTLLYRGLGGLIDLPDKFHEADAQGRSGYLDWGMMSTSSDRDVALGYSGVKQRRPRAMVMVIEATSVDRGADISEFSQYPGEKEFLWVPCSFVQRAQRGGGRVQIVDGGLVTFVPVRVNLNLKTETVEELLEKKKSIHITGFEFRVNELRQKLQAEAEAGGAEARLKKDKDSLWEFWEKDHSVGGYIDAQVKKVEAVLARHRARAAADYSDDAVYRSLVSESLEAARMAESALLWWLRDEGQNILFIEDYSLLQCHRRFESFLRLRHSRAADDDGRRAAAVDLCRARNLLRVDANERDDNGEALLIAFAAGGGSVEDVELLVAAGADVAAVAEAGRSAMFFAAQQGHAEVIEALARAGANCNQADTEGTTPMLIACESGHVTCVDSLIRVGADMEKASTDNWSTPLIIASQQGHSNVIDALLRAGADINKANNDGGTPLVMASQHGHSNVVDALLRAGADINKATNEDVTPLYIASQNGHSNVVDALLCAGADVNKAQNDGATPLNMASQNGDSTVVDALLRAGADVNKARNDGATPLIIACFCGHQACVEALVRARADLTLAWEGQTPLAQATKKGHTDIVSILQAAAAAERTRTAAEAEY